MKFREQRVSNFLVALCVAVVSCVSFFGLGDFARAASSWYPKKSCRDVWHGKDLAKYQPDNDAVFSAAGNTGYASTYLKRLAKAGVDRKSCFKEWTVLVYMAGDNNLSPYALWDLDEMEGRFESSRSAGSTLKTDLVVQLDTEGPTGVRRLHVFQREDIPYIAGTSVDDYRSRTPHQISSPIIRLFSETGISKLDSDQGARLQNFLEWGVREYPAEHYMVVVWGHGQGWTAEADPRTGKFGGIMGDPEKGDSLSIPALRDALAKTVRDSLDGRPIDVYASDACLMQMSEVAYEIAPSARFIAGSAQVQTFVGLPYRRVMYELNTGRFLSVAGSVGKDDEPLLMAKMLPLLVEQSLDPIHGQQGRAEPLARKTFTMSTLSSETLRVELAPAMLQVSRSLRDYVKEDFFRAADLAQAMKNAPSFMGGGKELGSFISLVETSRTDEIAKTAMATMISRKLGAALNNARTALDHTIVEHRFGTQYQDANHPYHLLGYRGLGVWVPSNAREFKERASDFALSSFEADTEWPSWLKPALGVSP
ncbi:hypothetical protein BH10BDE1_BH10BDE1_21540 [soil metagenome]